ncbi:MAG: rubrerythrin family protein [Bacteroidales bacterium]|nr:ferritin family protein [Anaerotignum sp.]MCI5680076.1 rubrerythrin family protein [Bacteroidales bacterium]MDY3927730.1 ferritin family protein [Anaerotignum sp.]
MDFKNSETKENLMRAFAGESQARNRYTFAASQAKQQKMHVVEAVFSFTANQEKEHAEIFYNHLKELSGENIHIDGSYPVDIYESVLEVLRAAQHNEYEEFDPVYKAFGDKAMEEGFPKVAASFHHIAGIEKIHGDRFGQLADLLEQNKLFINDVECKWMCLNCGFVYEGKEAPQRCPVCDHDKGFFIRLELAPYTK